MLTVRFGIPQISTGDILRAAVREGTPMGVKAKDCMDAGALVGDEIVVGIVRERLLKDDCLPGFILDGFPRNVAQADALKETLAALGKELDVVVSLDVDTEALVERLTGRRTCRDCGRGYHVKFDPPSVADRCDACGGELFQREDDQESTIRHRLDVYQQQTAPLIDYYRRAGLLSVIDGMQEMNAVQEQLLAVCRTS
jgi:adenylate kinase